MRFYLSLSNRSYPHRLTHLTTQTRIFGFLRLALLIKTVGQCSQSGTISVYEFVVYLGQSLSVL